jgi:hypothetical protein
MSTRKHSRQAAHHSINQGSAHKKKSPTAAIFMGIIGLIFGLSFGWFTGGQQWAWCLAGGLAGLSMGYLFGRAIDRSLKR